MYIKQLIKDEKEYWNFVWPFVEWNLNPNKSLWREEDYPKLKPFFDKQGSGNWDDSVSESFDFYEKCSKEYGKKNQEIRDAVSQFNYGEILEGFGYKVPDDTDDDEEYCNAETPLPFDEDFQVTFPFIVIGQISSEHDRLGKMRIMDIYMVPKKDFE